MGGMAQRLSSLSLFFGFFLAEGALAQAVSEFPLPTGSCLPTQIIAGPDGNLCFADYPGCGRITTSGDVTQIAIRVAVSASDLAFDAEGQPCCTDDANT